MLHKYALNIRIDQIIQSFSLLFFFHTCEIIFLWSSLYILYHRLKEYSGIRLGCLWFVVYNCRPSAAIQTKKGDGKIIWAKPGKKSLLTLEESLKGQGAVPFSTTQPFLRQWPEKRMVLGKKVAALKWGDIQSVLGGIGSSVAAGGRSQHLAHFHCSRSIRLQRRLWRQASGCLLDFLMTEPLLVSFLFRWSCLRLSFLTSL